MDEQVHKYNILIQQLLEQLGAELPNNPHVDTIKRRFRVALSLDRTYIIEETSPELFQYRDFIYSGDIDSLITKNWEADIDKKDSEIMYEIDNHSLRDMINMLRGIWSNYSTDDRDYIRRTLKRLLSYCIKYYNAKKEGRQ